MQYIIIKESYIKQFDDERWVFANKDFKKWEIVIRYNLKCLSEEEFDSLWKEEKEFVHEHNWSLYLYSIPERYVNHSDIPNTYQDKDEKK